MITTSADADKISAIETEHYISERAKRDRKDAFKNVLNRVPKRTPLPGDEL